MVTFARGQGVRIGIKKQKNISGNMATEMVTFAKLK